MARPLQPLRPRRRDAAVDTLRLVAVVTVVVAHVSAGAVAVTLTHSATAQAFFLASGWLWTPGRGLGDELRRRVRTLLVPYAAWLVLVLAVALVVHRLRGETRAGLQLQVGQALLGGSYAGRPFSAYWFLTALLVAVLLWRAVERLPVAARVAVALAGLAVSHADGPALAEVPLSAGTALGCVAFVAAGQGLRAVRPRLGVAAPYVGVVLVVGGLTLFGTYAVEPVFLKGGEFGTPLLSPLASVAVPAGLLLVLEAVVPRLPRAVGDVAVALAPVLVVVVLVHALVLDLLLPAGLGVLPVAVLAFVLPLLLGLLLRRSARLAPLATGQPR